MQPPPRGIRHSREQIKGIGAGCLPMENPSPIFSPGAVCRVFSPISISKAASTAMPHSILLSRRCSCWDLRMFLMSFPPPSWLLEQDQPGMSWPWADRHVPVAFHQLGTSGPSPAPQPSHPSHGSAREIPQPAIPWAAHSCWVLWEGSFCTPEHQSSQLIAKNKPHHPNTAARRHPNNRSAGVWKPFA